MTQVKTSVVAGFFARQASCRYYACWNGSPNHYLQGLYMPAGAGFLPSTVHMISKYNPSGLFFTPQKARTISGIYCQLGDGLCHLPPFKGTRNNHWCRYYACYCPLRPKKCYLNVWIVGGKHLKPFGWGNWEFQTPGTSHCLGSPTTIMCIIWFMHICLDVEFFYMINVTSSVCIYYIYKCIFLQVVYMITNANLYGKKY